MFVCQRPGELRAMSGGIGTRAKVTSATRSASRILSAEPEPESDHAAKPRAHDYLKTGGLNHLAGC
jgi:hypothetical protein